MSSRLIAQLDAAIHREADPLRRECLKAERACALARHGLLADARFALAGVRAQNQRLRVPVLGAWVSLLEGLIEHFQSIAPTAKAKFQRAHQLAVEAGDRSMQSLALAWIATHSFNASDMPAMVAQLHEALVLARPDNRAAHARIGLVLADAYRFAGDDVQAQRWYTHARSHAAAQGDASMISALLHNVSAMRSARIGLDDAFGRADREATRLALLEAESTANYDSGAGAEALEAMVPVIRAQLMVVLGRYQEAVTLFNAHLARARSEGMAHREARFLADRAWCQWNLDRPYDAERDVKAAEKVLLALFDADDLAAAHGRLAQVLAARGQTERAQVHREAAELALADYQAEQARVLAVLDDPLLRLE